MAFHVNVVSQVMLVSPVIVVSPPIVVAHAIVAVDPTWSSHPDLRSA